VHDRAERYHPRASCLRQTSQTDVNHNPMISLNSFRVGLLARPKASTEPSLPPPDDHMRASSSSLPRAWFEKATPGGPSPGPARGPEGGGNPQPAVVSKPTGRGLKRPAEERREEDCARVSREGVGRRNVENCDTRGRRPKMSPTRTGPPKFLRPIGHPLHDKPVPNTPVTNLAWCEIVTHSAAGSFVRGAPPSGVFFDIRKIRSSCLFPCASGTGCCARRPPVSRAGCVDWQDVA